MPHARISITLPGNLVKAADRRASELQRSRSWLLAEALRQFLGAPNGATHAARVSEPGATYATREVAAARSRHLAADLKLPPGERLQRAEDLGRLARQARQRAPRRQIIAFDTYEDFYRWKRAHLAGA
jgi:hypothetical protein